MLYVVCIKSGIPIAWFSLRSKAEEYVAHFGPDEYFIDVFFPHD